MIEPWSPIVLRVVRAKLLTRVHGRHPSPDTRLELAKGPPNSRMRRYPAANRADSPTLRDQGLVSVQKARSGRRRTGRRWSPESVLAD